MVYIVNISSSCLRFLYLTMIADADALTIPDICHLDRLCIGGEKLVMWRNFRFQYMTDVEKSKISPHEEDCQIFPHNRSGECEILPNWDEFHISLYDRCEEI